MYTLIAYKPDSTQVFRGCSTNHFSSACFCYWGLDQIQLIHAWAYIIDRNRGMKAQEDPFEVRVYVDGTLVWEENCFCNYIEDKPPDTDLLVAADYLEERGFTKAAVVLREQGKEIDSDRIKAEMEAIKRDAEDFSYTIGRPNSPQNDSHPNVG